VLVIVLDTLRADHLGCYGYARPTSPAIDAFTARATRFERCTSTAPWTLPSHASLFTGRFPFEHGLHTWLDAQGHETLYPLDEGELTLAEALAQEGFQTAAFVANAAYLDARYRLDQGFQAWHVERGWAPTINAHALEFLRRAHAQPFLLFLNYLDTHRVYNTTPRPGVTETPAVQDGGELLDRLIAAVQPGEAGAPAELAARVVDQYDTAVANVDAAVGEILRELETLGLYDDTLVVITSDHGEYLGEHRLAGHGKDVYAEATSVPLIVKAPGQRTGRVDARPASLAHVPGLVVEALPEELRARWQARFPRTPGSGMVLAENWWAREKDLSHPRWGQRFKRVRTAWIDWPYKLIRSSDGAHELYDLERDPRERTNLFASQPERARALLAALEAAQAADPAADPAGQRAPVRRDEGLERTLRALGYAGDDR
jgi:arylsulfatase A-like enzyme